jgi:hypothetical protein
MIIPVVRSFTVSPLDESNEPSDSLRSSETLSEHALTSHPTRFAHGRRREHAHEPSHSLCSWETPRHEAKTVENRYDRQYEPSTASG